MKEIIKVCYSGKLEGCVSIDGSKNSALACLAAASVTEDSNPIELRNVPDISDVRIMIDILRDLGKTIDFEGGVVRISGQIVNSLVLPKYSKQLRGSMYFLGILSATTGIINCGVPGGDKIGNRPLDIHIYGLKKLGVSFFDEKCEIITGKVEDKLVGNTIYLKYPSVGATCNLMLAATLAEGKTILTNVAKEPEVVDMANLLLQMGAKITGAGSDKILISGVESLHGGVSHEVISDRIQAGVIASTVAACGGDVYIKNVIPYHNYPLISLIRDIGVIVEEGDDYLRVTRLNELNPLEADMMPFPGLATDLQSSISLIATQANGVSKVSDLVFQNRFQYVKELKKMGAEVSLSGNSLKIYGGKRLEGCSVYGNDIRAVSALIGAGMVAEGETYIDGVIHLRRGYPDFLEKMQSIGGKVSFEMVE